MAVMALLAWVAFVMSRTLQRRKVPELVGFIAAGILVGPSGHGLLDSADLSRLRPITEFALATLMFLDGCCSQMLGDAPQAAEAYAEVAKYRKDWTPPSPTVSTLP